MSCSAFLRRVKLREMLPNDEQPFCPSVRRPDDVDALGKRRYIDAQHGLVTCAGLEHHAAACVEKRDLRAFRESLNHHFMLRWIGEGTK